MREKFELSCKVVGLIFFCWGILTFFGAIVFFILKPDYVQMLTESTRDAYIQSQIEEIQDVSSNVLQRYIIIVIILSIMEMLLGFYLMKSNNLFIKLCCPIQSNKSIELPVDIKLNSGVKENQKSAEESSKDKYAPPGYF